MSSIGMEQHDLPVFEYGLDETGGPAFFWNNPWKNGQREKIAMLLWPEHPPHATEQVEHMFDHLRLVYSDDKTPNPAGVDERIASLEEKARIIRSGNTAITKEGQIVDQTERPDAMPYESANKSIPASPLTSVFDHGRSAALRGCFRILVCPGSPEEYADWLAGYDSVRREDRGKWPRTGPVPPALAHLSNSALNPTSSL